MSDAAFYCMSSELYFPGAVGLINSLRLHGHTEPIFLLDCGLTPEHRELVAAEATIVPGPADVPPYLLKTIAPRRHPAGTMVLIDVDMERWPRRWPPGSRRSWCRRCPTTPSTGPGWRGPAPG